jgi:hypothetical protein
VSHQLKELDTSGWFFKLRFLRDEVSRLDYDYYVWLDADTYFVRDPGNLLRLMRGSPVHVCMESDICRPDNKRPDWWGCSLKNCAALMRFMGVRSRAIFNTNGGFWIVHRGAVSRFCELVFEFADAAKKLGLHQFCDEPCLAYAMQMLCGDPYAHTLKETADVWASEWTGVYKNRLPDGEPWTFTDYFNFETFEVNPAIVHAMRSKNALMGDAPGYYRPWV